MVEAVMVGVVRVEAVMVGVVRVEVVMVGVARVEVVMVREVVMMEDVKEDVKVMVSSILLVGVGETVG